MGNSWNRCDELLNKSGVKVTCFFFIVRGHIIYIISICIFSNYHLRFAGFCFLRFLYFLFTFLVKMDEYYYSRWFKKTLHIFFVFFEKYMISVGFLLHSQLMNRVEISVQIENKTHSYLSPIIQQLGNLGMQNSWFCWLSLIKLKSLIFNWKEKWAILRQAIGNLFCNLLL